MEVKHGRLKLCQLYRRDSNRPDVAEVIVAALPLHSRHLRGHPVGRPDEGFPFAQRCRYLFPRGTTLIAFLICSVADPDPNPDPHPPDPRVLLDPDPLVRGMDPDLDPFIIKQK